MLPATPCTPAACLRVAACRLNLLGVLVTAAAAAAGDAQAQLVPQLLALDLLPLLASVLHGWVVRLRAEQQLFAGGSGGAAADEAATAAQQAEAAPAEAAAAAAGDDDPPAASIVPPAPGSPAQWDEKAVAAAEVTEEAALEALGLLEVLAADAAGEPALNAAGAHSGAGVAGHSWFAWRTAPAGAIARVQVERPSALA